MALWFSVNAQNGSFWPLLDAAARVEQRLAPEVQTAIATCMSSRGATYQPRAVGSSGRSPNPYEIVASDEQQAGTYLRVTIPDSADPNDSYVRSLSPEEQKSWMRALVGDGEARTTIRLPSGRSYSYVPDACAITAAESVLGTGFQAAYFEVQDEAALVTSRTEGDARVQKAVALWSACVQESGEGPVAGLGDLRARVLNGTADQGSEVRLFQIDLTCERRSGVVEVLGQVQSENEIRAASEASDAFGRLITALGIDGVVSAA